IKAGAKRLSDFFSKQLLWVLMVGVGVCYTDLQEIIDALTFANVVIAANHCGRRCRWRSYRGLVDWLLPD
ncbi:hypothetical protein LFZ31_24380, partial [Salmonella enterica subsp. enterica serovar Newport str. S09097]